MSEDSAADEGLDPVEDMLSWRFKAGGIGLFMGVPTFLLAADQWDADRSMVMVAVGPVGLSAYATWRYLLARRDAIARGLWPQSPDDPADSAT